jgi:hypothetical protein
MISRFKTLVLSDGKIRVKFFLLTSIVLSIILTVIVNLVLLLIF